MAPPSDDLIRPVGGTTADGLRLGRAEPIARVTRRRHHEETDEQRDERRREELRHEQHDAHRRSFWSQDPAPDAAAYDDQGRPLIEDSDEDSGPQRHFDATV